jgi:hypothetical protein
VLDAICSGRACAGITPSASADMATLAARLRSKPLVGDVVLPNGHRVHGETLTEADLAEIMFSGDFDPVLRTALPGALRSALEGDPGPILRAELWAMFGSGPTDPGAMSSAVFLATACEDLMLPWPRTSPISDHLALAQAALSGLPASAFGPFDVSTALSMSPLSDCAAWPQATPLPVLDDGGVLPDVPTLILSGDEDVRTPRSDAQRVAALLPQSHLVAVPDSGHSVLTSEPGDCANRAVISFFADAPIAACGRSPHRLAVAPLAPTFAGVPPARGTRGRDGRTIAAVLDTVADVRRSAFEAASLFGSPLAELQFGGLRGGRFSGRLARGLKLDDVVYVPGVKVRGKLSLRPVSGRLTVSGKMAARGTLTIAKGKISARFGKRVLHLPLGRSVAVASAAPIAVSPRPWSERTWWWSVRGSPGS